MSEMNNRRERDFSKYDSMTTDELQQILRLDAMQPVGKESDTEELFYIMEVLAVRRKNNSPAPGKTAQQAFEEFTTFYMPKDVNEEPINTVPATKKNPSVLWLRRLTTVAAAFAIVFFTALTTNAFGFDLFGRIAKWSAEIFHLESSPEATIAPNDISLNEFGSLQQTLTEHQISHRLAPTWLPDGYYTTEVKVTETPHEKIFYTKYVNECDDEISITIRQVLTGVPFSVEKNEDFVEIYECDGIAYYIMSNHERTCAAWVVDAFEGYIIGNITIEDLKVIIDSI